MEIAKGLLFVMFTTIFYIGFLHIESTEQFFLDQIPDYYYRTIAQIFILMTILYLGLSIVYDR